MLKRAPQCEISCEKKRLPDAGGIEMEIENNINGRGKRVEIAQSNFKTTLISEIITARSKRGITQKKLEEMSGVKQPVISKIEQGVVTPNLSTILKILAALGKTLYIDDVQS